MTLDQPPASAASRTGALPVGFQLWTVRGECARNLPRTLKTLADLGYQGVEFFGYAGTPKVYKRYSAADLRQLLDEHGLKCCGMHLELQALGPGTLHRTIAVNHTLGSEFLNLAMSKEHMRSEPGIAELADILNRAATECQPHRLTVGYHAHGFDFARINGRSAWELLFRRTQPEVNMQLDIGNCLAGDGDPIALLQAFPGRARTVHLKEHRDKTLDSDYFREIYRLCETIGGTQWYIVEMGGLLGNGFGTPREALARLRQAGK